MVAEGVRRRHARHRARTRRGRQLRDWGFVDGFRRVYPDEERLFTYWDYRRGDFHQHRGMRIDLAYVTEPLVDRIRWGLVDRFARKGKLPSDHAPLFLDIDVDSA